MSLRKAWTNGVSFFRIHRRVFQSYWSMGDTPLRMVDRARAELNFTSKTPIHSLIHIFISICFFSLVLCANLSSFLSSDKCLVANVIIILRLWTEFWDNIVLPQLSSFNMRTSIYGQWKNDCILQSQQESTSSRSYNSFQQANTMERMTTERRGWRNQQVAKGHCRTCQSHRPSSSSTEDPGLLGFPWEISMLTKKRSYDSAAEGRNSSAFPWENHRRRGPEWLFTVASNNFDI